MEDRFISDIRPRLLILGGTTEARQLAERLALRPDLDTVVSLAGRTIDPRPMPVKTRIGGFGGAAGLADYIRNENMAMVVDATHPFANRISANAAEAAALAGVPILALCRPGWERQDDDQWMPVTDVEAAVDALGEKPRRVFLAIGRQEAYRFSRARQHFYLVRSVDPVEPPLAVTDARYILASGPFEENDELRLLVENGIDVIACKNSGGSATYGKIAAARALGIAVVMIERQVPPGMPTVDDVASALEAIDHRLAPVMKRGV